MTQPLILAADIGGTKSNLAWCVESDGGINLLEQRSYSSRDFADFEQVLLAFLEDTGKVPAMAAFAVAGAVLDGVSIMPNLGWRLDASRLAAAIGLPQLLLLNDLEAMALGLAVLAPDRLLRVQGGRVREQGNRALIAAGTGLGAAVLCRTEGGYQVSATEAGHVDFAPTDEEQIELLRYLQRRFGHVSNERVVSGPGLLHIYEFLKETGREWEPVWLAEELSRAADRSALIGEHCRKGSVGICDRAMDIFIRTYGAAAGDLALVAMATGGLYLGGGIAPKLKDALLDGRFIAAFIDKGRFRDLMEEIPVHLVLEPLTPVLGAGYAALQA